MIEHNNKPYDFEFESSGRKLSCHGSQGFNVYNDGSITYGYDGSPKLVDENGGHLESQYIHGFELFDTEKRELAIWMIKRWANYGNVSVNMGFLFNPKATEPSSTRPKSGIYPITKAEELGFLANDQIVCRTVKEEDKDSLYNWAKDESRVNFVLTQSGWMPTRADKAHLTLDQFTHFLYENWDTNNFSPLDHEQTK